MVEGRDHESQTAYESETTRGRPRADSLAGHEAQLWRAPIRRDNGNADYWGGACRALRQPDCGSAARTSTAQAEGAMSWNSRSAPKPPGQAAGVLVFVKSFFQPWLQRQIFVLWPTCCTISFRSQFSSRSARKSGRANTRSSIPDGQLHIGIAEPGRPGSSMRLRRIALTTATVRLVVSSFRIAFLM